MNAGSWVPGLFLVAFSLALGGLPQPAARAADTTAPTGTIVINNNRSATNTPNATLALTWTDGVGGSGVSRMRFSDDGAHWSAWEVLSATRAYTLPSGDGHKTVRVQYLDKANNRSATYSDFILLDTAVPTGSIVVNSGMAATATTSVTLGLGWSDGAGAGVSRVRFSDDGAHWTAWMPPQAEVPHTLAGPAGYNTVRVQYQDGAGNYSSVYSDYIKLVPDAEETVMLAGGVPLVMVWVPGGTFTMGSPESEQNRYVDEGPQHAVTLNGFWVGKYELTKRQWVAVMGTTPWAGQDYVLDNLDSPAQCVSWQDAHLFTAALNSSTGKTFRLPSESEWEYACRRGTPTRFYWGDDLNDLLIGYYAWWNTNAYRTDQQYPRVAGQKWANGFDLCDMSGNVSEWCEDYYQNSYGGTPTDGSASLSPESAYRVYRGGDWSSFSPDCRSAARHYNYPSTVSSNIGIRLARS